MSDGDIIIDTDLNTDGAERGVKSLGAKLGGLAKNGIKAFTGAIAVTGAALGTLGAIGLKYNSEMEQYMGSFTTMLGSAEKAAQHMEELKTFAAKTPFEMADLAQASTTLQAFGIEAKNITPTLKMLGDISLGNKEKFNGLALVFGQVQSQGKLMGQDLMQMINQGFNPLQIISEKTGKSMSQLKDEMSQGKISFEMVADAMKTATSEGGKFYNAMETQSKTLSGQLSTLKDNANALAGEIFQPLTDSVKNTLLPQVNSYMDQISEAFKTKGVAGITSSFGDIMASIITAVATNLPQFITLAVNIIQSFISGIQNNLPMIVNAVLNVIQTLITSFITMLPQIIQLGLQLVIYLGNGIAEAIPSLIPQIINLVISIADMITNNVGAIVETGIKVLTALAKGIIDALPTLIEKVPQIINNFANAIYNQFPTIISSGIKIIGMLIKGLIQAIPTLIANIPQIILAIVNAITLYNWFSLGSKLINWIRNGIESMTGSIGSVAKNVAEWVGKTIVNIFKGGLSWGKNLISSIGSGFSSMTSFLINSAKSIAISALNAIKSAFSSAVDIGKNLIKGIWEGIKGMGSWISEKVGGFAGNIIDGMKKKFGIHSPSRVMRDEVGVQIVRGIEVGIEERSGKALALIESFSNDIIEKLKETNSKELDEISKNNAEIAKIQKRSAEDIESIRGRAYTKDKKGKVKVRQLTKDELIRIQRIEEDSAKKIQDLRDKNRVIELKSAQDFNKEFLDQVEKFVSDKRNAGEMNLLDEITFWNELGYKSKVGSDAYKLAQKNHNDKVKELRSNMEQINKDYVDKIQQIDKDLLDKTNQLNGEYDKAYENRFNSLNNFAKLFDEFKENIDVTGIDLIYNLQSQVTALDDYEKVMDSLGGRISNTMLLDELKGLGVQSLGELKALNSLTDSQLNQYVILYEKKFKMASEQATNELKPMRDDINNQITKLQEESNIKLQSLNDSWQKEIRNLVTGTSDEMDSMYQVGIDAITNLNEGFKNMQPSLIDTATSIAGNIVRAFESELGLIGEMTSAKQVINDNLSGISSKMKAAVNFETSNTARAMTAGNIVGGQSYTTIDTGSTKLDITLKVPVNLDGRQVAEVSSPYSDTISGKRLVLNNRGVVL